MSSLANPILRSALPSAALERVSVIICTRGRSSDLANTLASLAAVEVSPRFEVELLVVENGTREGVDALVARFRHPVIRARYLFEAAHGKSNALNRAVAAAAGDILLFTDDDIRFPARWVDRMCEPIVSGRADAVAGAVCLAPHLLRDWMNHTHRAWLASTADYLTPSAPSEMCGANMAIRRDALAAVGGFDPELGPGVTAGGEESLVSWQLKRAGYRLSGAFDVAVEHHLNPNRLQYGNWVRTARLQGHTRGYLLHHWFQRRIRFPRTLGLCLRLKLAARRLLSLRRRPTDEGIAPWELSYREDIAKCARYVAERRRPAKYSSHMIRKSKPEIPVPAA